LKNRKNYIFYIFLVILNGPLLANSESKRKNMFLNC